MGILLSPAFWAAIALAAALAWGGYQKTRADLAEEKAENAGLQLESVGSALGRQNVAVDDWKKAGQDARQRAAKAQAAADQAQRAAQPEIDALRARIAAAAPAGKTCSDALAEIRGGT